MSLFKILFDGEELDEAYSSYEDAEDAASEAIGAWREGSEIIELSNPGDYPFDSDDEPDVEIVEVDD